MLRPLGVLQVVLDLRAQDLVISPYASFASVRLSCVASDLDMGLSKPGQRLCGPEAWGIRSAVVTFGHSRGAFDSRKLIRTRFRDLNTKCLKP